MKVSAVVHAACKCNKIPFNLRSACQDKDNNVFLLVLNYRRNSRNFFFLHLPRMHFITTEGKKTSVMTRPINI